VVFVIEDNAWGISVAKQASTAIERNYLRAAAYGMPGVFVPGNDTDAIFAAASAAIERARAGGGPSLIEIETSRLAGHFMGDGEQYRPAGEKEALQAKDPIPAYRQRLLELGVLDERAAEEIAARARGRVDEAVLFARESPYPAPEEALEKVFV
jgi:pyruvate dehydrogenase E1 component alpha subunit